MTLISKSFLVILTKFCFTFIFITYLYDLGLKLNLKMLFRYVFGYQSISPILGTVSVPGLIFIGWER